MCWDLMFTHIRHSPSTAQGTRPLPGPTMKPGWSQSVARSVAPGLIAAADCVVSGPYRADRPAANRLLASDNQVLTFANRDVELRYRRWLTAEGPQLQVTADDSDLYLVGLTRPGDLDEFAVRMSERGVQLGAVSWRA